MGCWDGPIAGFVAAAAAGPCCRFGPKARCESAAIGANRRRRQRCRRLQSCRAFGMARSTWWCFGRRQEWCARGGGGSVCCILACLRFAAVSVIGWALRQAVLLVLQVGTVAEYSLFMRSET
ncbi:hypothetical protein BCR44DRAFT_1439902, partial [Catenaria anguillulae PL171]